MSNNVGLLIGAGWMPDDHLIQEARNGGAFGGCDRVICQRGTAQMNRQTAMYAYQEMMRTQGLQDSGGRLAYQTFNMGSGRTLWAIYPS